MGQLLKKVAYLGIDLFLCLSAAIAAVWLARYSGIVWATPLGFVNTFWAVLLGLAKNWGPLFVPTAAVIFVFKMFEKNVAYEILTLLKPEVERHVSSSVGTAIDSVVAHTSEPGMRRYSLAAIRCTLRALARRSLITPGDIRPMYDATKRDFDQMISVSIGEEPA